ncbi:MAG: transposase, partial [Phenylobacterium zucineum]
MLDAGFGEFRRQLTYKSGWYGANLVLVDRWLPSSKTCSACGWHNPDLTLADRTFRCAQCGLSIDRDLNAAINIAAATQTTEPSREGRPTPARAKPARPPRDGSEPDPRDERDPEATY